VHVGAGADKNFLDFAAQDGSKPDRDGLLDPHLAYDVCARRNPKLAVCRDSGRSTLERIKEA
jgi:hypothetical protein